MRATRSMLRPVFVVEDHADSRQMLCAFLAVSGFPCVSVTSAKDALLELQTQRPWLIMLDLIDARDGRCRVPRTTTTTRRDAGLVALMNRLASLEVVG